MLLAIYVSVKTKKSNLFAELYKKDAILESGCKNWKKATEKFGKHEAPNCHKATMTYEVVLSTCGDNAEMSNENKKKNREQNPHSLMIVSEAIRLLACQGLPSRGNKEDEPNLKQILKFSAKLCPDLES